MESSNQGLVVCKDDKTPSLKHVTEVANGGHHRQELAVEDKYPLPNMADLAARLDGCRMFSKLDLRKGYLQVPVATEDIAKTAIITPFG